MVQILDGGMLKNVYLIIFDMLHSPTMFAH